jgi:hypothetical protein
MSILDFFSPQSEKRGFRFAPFFQTQQCLKKWRHFLVPHRRLLKNEFFSNLLGDTSSTTERSENDEQRHG